MTTNSHLMHNNISIFFQCRFMPSNKCSAIKNKNKSLLHNSVYRMQSTGYSMQYSVQNAQDIHLPCSALCFPFIPSAPLFSTVHPPCTCFLFPFIPCRITHATFTLIHITIRTQLINITDVLCVHHDPSPLSSLPQNLPRQGLNVLDG